ncbi:MAG: tetratricopeptide repeat protein [Kiritimatiellaeota bacterium]|nr:tetratricopeptide repeat protein [Kiritimatiellota bacterium]
MYVDKGDWVKARETAEKMTVLKPDYATGFILLVRAGSQEYLTAKTQIEKDEILKTMSNAVNELERIVGSDDYHFLYHKGIVLTSSEQYEEAREYCLKAVEKTDDKFFKIPALYRILLLDSKLADNDAKEKHARIVLEIDVDNGYANFCMGHVELSNENYESAVIYFERAFASNPRYLNALNNLAFAKLKLGKLDEAEKIIMRALEIYDSEPMYHDTFGEILYAKGEYPKSYAKFQDAVKLDATNTGYLFKLHLAAAAYKIGRVDEARELMEAIKDKTGGFAKDDMKMYEQLKSDLFSDTTDRIDNIE